MKINTKCYERSFEDFKLYYPYLVDRVVSIRPWGTRGIQLTMEDGSRYNYDSQNHSIRKYEECNPERAKQLDDERCRDMFAINLIELMDARGFSQNSLSERTGISKGAINNYINKKASPTLSALYKLAYVLDCTIGDLTGY